MERIAVAIVDDAELVVAGVKAMLAPFSDRLEVVSAQVGRVEPIHADVVLVDASGSPDAGLLRIHEVLDLGTVSHAVLYTWRISDEGIQSYLAVGASGVLSKASTAQQIARSIEQLHRGEQVVDDFGPLFGQPCEGTSGDLSSRDIQILTLVAKGFDNAEIGLELFLAESTVKTYIKRLYQRLDVHTRAQAVLRAVEMGLTPHQPGA